MGIGTGIQYDWNKDVTEDPPMNIWMRSKQRSIRMAGLSRGPLKGEYDTNAIHFFGVNLIWKFESTIRLINAIHNLH
jgi:hypothetical protein